MISGRMTTANEIDRVTYEKSFLLQIQKNLILYI